MTNLLPLWQWARCRWSVYISTTAEHAKWPKGTAFNQLRHAVFWIHYPAHDTSSSRSCNSYAKLFRKNEIRTFPATSLAPQAFSHCEKKTSRTTIPQSEPEECAKRWRKRTTTILWWCLTASANSDKQTINNCPTENKTLITFGTEVVNTKQACAKLVTAKHPF